MSNFVKEWMQGARKADKSFEKFKLIKFTKLACKIEHMYSCGLRRNYEQTTKDAFRSYPSHHCNLAYVGSLVE